MYHYISIHSITFILYYIYIHLYAIYPVCVIVCVYPDIRVRPQCIPQASAEGGRGRLSLFSFGQWIGCSAGPPPRCSRMPCVCPMRHTLEWLRGWLQQTGQLQTQGENAGWVESWELFGVPEFRYAHMGGKHVETKITTSRWWATGRALCKDGLLARLAESTGRGGSFWGYLRSKFNVDWVVGRRWNPRELSVWLSMSC